MAVLNQGTITDSPELDDWLTTASTSNMATNGYSYASSNNYTINTNSPYYTINTTPNTAGTIWTTSGLNGSSSSSGKITLDGDDADVIVNGKSLYEFMTKMEERLAILVPDPEKLERFAALKKAYDHYKLMEKLCHEEPTDND
jgi:hypothetical protein